MWGLEACGFGWFLARKSLSGEAHLWLFRPSIDDSLSGWAHQIEPLSFWVGSAGSVGNLTFLSTYSYSLFISSACASCVSSVGCCDGVYCSLLSVILCAFGVLLVLSPSSFDRFTAARVFVCSFVFDIF